MSLDLPSGDVIRDPAAFADACVRFNEKGQPWSLSRHQRRVLARFFRRDAQGRLLFRLLLWAEMKKSGKTLLAGFLVLWWGMTTPNTEIILAANDFEQSVGRVFLTLVALIKHNHPLQNFAKVKAASLEFSNGTVVRAIASDYTGAAGSRHSLYVVDEPWGIMQERAVRLIEELTPPPTEVDAWGLMTTTAGFVGESKMLEALYHRGLAGTRVDDELELYEADELFMFWSHTPRQPWQTQKYYAEQRRLLRESTYLRLHENRWVTAESGFITSEMWDACVETSWSPMEPTRGPAAIVAIDAAYKHDLAAAVMVIRDGDQVIVTNHRLWRPSASAPLDFEATIEKTVLEWHRDYRVVQVVADPYQMISTLGRLRARGVNALEFPQTPDRLTAMTTTLYDAILGGTLIAYPAPDLRECILNAVVVESPRGARLAKEKAHKKIDGAVALGMAVAVAMTLPVYDGRPLVW